MRDGGGAGGERALRHQLTQQNVPAIIHMSHNSQEEGTAIADVLFGDYTPPAG